MRVRRPAVERWLQKMERAPGLAPGKSGFASRRLDDFGIARALKWGGRRVLPPLGDLHRIECWLLHHGLHLKVFRLSPRRRPPLCLRIRPCRKMWSLRDYTRRNGCRFKARKGTDKNRRFWFFD